MDNGEIMATLHGQGCHITTLCGNVLIIGTLYGQGFNSATALHGQVSNHGDAARARVIHRNNAGLARVKLYEL